MHNLHIKGFPAPLNIYQIRFFLHLFYDIHAIFFLNKIVNVHHTKFEKYGKSIKKKTKILQILLQRESYLRVAALEILKNDFKKPIYLKKL